MNVGDTVTTFEAGPVRDCCLPAAVAEQRRLRRKLDEKRLANDFTDILDQVMDVGFQTKGSR